MKFTTTTMGTYIDSKITAVLNQVIKFTTIIIHNATILLQRQIVKTSASNTAQQIWGKRVQVVPLKNSIETMVSDMRDSLRRDFDQIINETLNNPTQSETNEEIDAETRIDLRYIQYFNIASWRGYTMLQRHDGKSPIHASVVDI